MLPPALAHFIKLVVLWHAFSEVGACLDREREALNTFRNALVDPSGVLSSWDQVDDCCKWRGISCDNHTGYVMKLDLHADSVGPRLSGQIHPALLQLKHLRFLDLSSNNFSGSTIPSFLGSMKGLRHLDLSLAGLSGRIPHQLGNLHKLVSLHLFSNSGLSADNLWLLTNMTSLEYLDMSFVNLSLATQHWVHAIMNSCPSLVVLRLESCALSFIPPFISPLNFSSLRVLHIPQNNFNSPIPNWIANISSLISLDLSSNNFSGRAPYQMSQLPNLEELSMGDLNDDLSPDWSVFLEGSWNKLKNLDLILSRGSIPESIGNITSLVRLVLTINGSSTIPDGLGRLKRLEHLDLFGELSGCIPASLGDLSSLKWLDLGVHELSGPIPASIGGLSSLKTLDLRTNQLNGTIPETLGRLSSLERLWLLNNQLSGTIPETLGGLSFLEELELGTNQLSGSIPASLGGLSSLRLFDLSMNQLNGTIPDALGGLSSVQDLNLQGNKLSGNIPKTLGRLSNLQNLYLSGNYLTGNISEAHFENLRGLRVLDLDDNPLVLDLQPDWIPPFQLHLLNLGSVRVGPQFPLWLRTQKMIDALVISNASVSGFIPNWFWDMRATLRFLSLSRNMLSGQLPNTLEMERVTYLDLSRNLFTGSIPRISAPSLNVLDLSNNQFSGPMPANFSIPRLFFSSSGNRINGSIPTSICKATNIVFLDLSNNSLSGTIPATFGNCTDLVALDLSGNYLSGSIPVQMGLLAHLNTVHLNRNGLSGELPLSLRNCSSLVTVDLGDNRFSGKIPSWIGKSFTGLRILRLRANRFTGGIPPELFRLTALQVFDVAGNCLSGPIPLTSEDLKAMKNKTRVDLTYEEFNYAYGLLYRSRAVIISYSENLIILSKRLSLTYTTTIRLLACIDLSSNNFSGQIPDALTTLSALNVLNLSGNHLIGNIPDSIGGLEMLESLDLSRNELSGTIPRSISSLYFLSSLNLSNNNLWGRIPSGKQLQALPDPTIYSGNAGLCGFPLSDCSSGKRQDEKDHPGTVGDHEDEADHDLMFWFYIGIAPGFVVGFWAVCGALILKKTWRIAYFHFVDDLEDKVYVFVMRWMARLKLTGR